MGNGRCIAATTFLFWKVACFGDGDADLLKLLGISTIFLFSFDWNGKGGILLCLDGKCCHSLGLVYYGDISEFC